MTFEEIRADFCKGSMNYTALYETIARMLDRFVEVEQAHGVTGHVVDPKPNVLVELTQQAIKAEKALLEVQSGRQQDRERVLDIAQAANGYRSSQVILEDLITTVARHRQQANDSVGRLQSMQDELTGQRQMNVNQADTIEALKRDLDVLNHEAGDLRLHIEELQEKLRTANAERDGAEARFVRLLERHIHIQRLGLGQEEENGNHIAAAVLRERIDMLNTVRTSATRGEGGPSLQDVLDNFTQRRDHAQRSIDSAGDRRDFESCNEAEWERDGWERACVELRAILKLPPEVAG